MSITFEANNIPVEIILDIAEEMRSEPSNFRIVTSSRGLRVDNKRTGLSDMYYMDRSIEDRIGFLTPVMSIQYIVDSIRRFKKEAITYSRVFLNYIWSYSVATFAKPVLRTIFKLYKRVTKYLTLELEAETTLKDDKRIIRSLVNSYQVDFGLSLKEVAKKIRIGYMQLVNAMSITPEEYRSSSFVLG